MRLLLVIDSLNSGGSQRQIVTLGRGLHAHGHHVEFYQYFPSDFFRPLLEEVGIPVHVCCKSFRYSPEPVMQLRRIIRQGHFDLILSRLPVPNLYVILARALSGLRVPVVVSEGSCPSPAYQGWKQPVIEQFYRMADHVVVNSHHNREYFTRKFPWLAGRVTTIWNGVDPQEFDYQPPPAVGEGWRLLSVGNLIPYKNCECLIEGLAHLRERHDVRPHVDWVGRFPEPGSPYKKYLDEMEQLIDRHGVRDQWTWLGKRSDVRDLMHQHHCLVHPSYVEGLPNVVCESLACGRPVVISNTLDHPRLIQSGQRGFLFETRSPESLAEALWQMCQCDDARLEQMSQHCRQFALDELALDRVTEQYENLFCQLSPNTNTAPSPT